MGNFDLTSHSVDIGFSAIGIDFVGYSRILCLMRQIKKTSLACWDFALVQVFSVVSFGMTEQIYILCVFLKHDAHESNRRVCASFLDCSVDGSVDKNDIIGGPFSISIKLGSTPDIRPIEIDPVSDEVITFTGLPWDFHAVCWLWDFNSSWLFDSPACLRSNFRNGTYQKATSWRLTVSRKAQVYLKLCHTELTSLLMKISFKPGFSHSSFYCSSLATGSSACSYGVLLGGWEMMVFSSSVWAVFKSIV